MSPVKDPSVYPPDWPEIRGRILKRSEVMPGVRRCECRGECGVDHPGADGRCIEKDRTKPKTFGGERVILTCAHLDHDASRGDHSEGNLKALCQSCHLRYDGNHRREKKMRKERAELAGMVLQLALSGASVESTDNGDGTYTHSVSLRGGE